MNRSLVRYYRPEIFSESVENGCLRGSDFNPFEGFVENSLLFAGDPATIYGRSECAISASRTL